MAGTINPFNGKIIKIDTEFCGRKLTFETGRLAFQAAGAVLVTYGKTVVLGVAQAADEAAVGFDYFPLSVDYEEKMYAAGKISGSRFNKREGRPTDEAVLVSRLIDRPIRPLFPKGYHNEVQCLAYVYSLDPEVKSDTVAMIAVSAALSLTGAPFAGPVAGVRIGLVDGKLKPYPSTSELKSSTLDLMVAGTKEAIMMVEAGASEVDEPTVVKALELAHKSIQPALTLQSELVKKVGVKAKEFELTLPPKNVTEEVDKFLKGKLGEKIRGGEKLEYDQRLDELKQTLLAALVKDDETDKTPYLEAYDLAIKAEVKRAILEDGRRPDNRQPDEIRPLSSEVGVLPQVHGSALFTRGSTQALNVTTLAPSSYAQLLDTMDENATERYFLHHYNMPSFSTGEIQRPRGPGRREIGHGALAERALRAVVPDVADFPYTIRTVSEILSGNGSTSMASVCSGCLSLMDAGIPIKAPVSGIAMGLMSDGKKFVVLSDIQGTEDFAGDMDFKVAGTANGITALQMDIKIQGITQDVMVKALDQAKTGRAAILKHMLSTLAEPRAELHPEAPRVESLKIDVEQIREVIGKGGETIQKITGETGTEIDIKDDGMIFVAAKNKVDIDKAIDWIKNLTAKPEIGKVYDGTVVKLMDFGAFVEFLPGKDGMVHISEIADHRVERVEDELKEGDKVRVKLIAIDDRGRNNLSIKRAGN
ncbi:MAG TPA: polyribonucleotide nucleotidyltransferase [Candidatus Saccharimonadales bacterium]